MTTISYQDIQYSREIYFYNRLRPVFENLMKNADFENKIQALEEQFYFQLSNSFKVDKLEYVTLLLKKIFFRLNIELKIDIFIFQSNIPNVFCIPRFKIDRIKDPDHMMILVSQHFFNDLNIDEQSTILGHEIGHFLFGHLNIPRDIILKNTVPFPESLNLKSDVLMWSICSEISSDILGLVANGLNRDAFISAMLKFTTGLNAATYNLLGEINLKNSALTQYKEITYSVHEEILNTHPITPLRLKLADKLAEKELLKKYGAYCSQSEINDFKTALNSHIDYYISMTYPDMIQGFKPKYRELLLKMSIAVALSDQIISHKEYEIIRNFVVADEQLGRKLYEVLEHDLKVTDRNTLIKRMIDESVESGQEKKIKKYDVIQVVRNLLIIACADSPLNISELSTILTFSLYFGINREEILFLKNQMRL